MHYICSTFSSSQRQLNLTRKRYQRDIFTDLSLNYECDNFKHEIRFSYYILDGLAVLDVKIRFNTFDFIFIILFEEPLTRNSKIQFYNFFLVFFSYCVEFIERAQTSRKFVLKCNKNNLEQRDLYDLLMKKINGYRNLYHQQNVGYCGKSKPIP